ncbi:hypothetical protein LOB10_02180 [Lactobacillus delbrueckii subsp. lactis]|uniref:hypothetical protein n=1 Tax=Lactobacillus delbrueckii TaxID=1584 RepID=UPI001E4FD3EF|nr:hypothetical protein [Lactobacillus delbrueckii]MCD5528897.1 hypothetical protein [Lactobacillus delbrueckii subsp. lactis]
MGIKTYRFDFIAVLQIFIGKEQVDADHRFAPDIKACGHAVLLNAGKACQGLEFGQCFTAIVGNRANCSCEGDRALSRQHSVEDSDPAVS